MSDFILVNLTNQTVKQTKVGTKSRSPRQLQNGNQKEPRKLTFQESGNKIKTKRENSNFSQKSQSQSGTSFKSEHQSVRLSVTTEGRLPS